MKTLPIVILFLAHLSICAQPYSSEMNASTDLIEISEEAKIVQSLKAETIAFYGRDYQGVIDGWIQDDDSVVAFTKKEAGYTFIRGWKGISEFYKSHIEKGKEVTHPDFNVADLKIEISEDFAFVIYNEYVANKDGKYSKVPGVKTLKKINGDWKLHSVISFWDYDYKYSKSEVTQYTAATGFDKYK